MIETPSEFPLDDGGFREVVRHPAAHALILGQYRIGEHAGAVALRRLLDEMEPAGNLRRAMEIHQQDEARHTRVFTDWIRRLGLEPEPLPADVEAFFSRTPEEFHERRRLLEQLPTGLRRVLVFAAINAIERLAYAQFEHHLLALDRSGDVAALERVMAEERFHLHYVDVELERQRRGPDGAMVTVALDEARARFEDFRQAREAGTRAAIERLLGPTAG